MSIETPADSLHTQFAKRAAETVKNKEITQRRVAAELYWLDEYLDNSTFLPDPESLVGEDGLDPIEDANYLDALATLRNPGLSVTQIHAALEPMTAEEINRLSTNVEQSIGPLLAAELEMDPDDTSEQYRERVDAYVGMRDECPDCQMGLALLVMSHVVHEKTLSPYTVMSVVHSSDEAGQSLYEDLCESLDGAWDRALEACS